MSPTRMNIGGSVRNEEDEEERDTWLDLIIPRPGYKQPIDISTMKIVWFQGTAIINQWTVPLE